MNQWTRRPLPVRCEVVPAGGGARRCMTTVAGSCPVLAALFTVWRDELLRVDPQSPGEYSRVNPQLALDPGEPTHQEERT